MPSRSQTLQSPVSGCSAGSGSGPIRGSTPIRVFRLFRTTAIPFRILINTTESYAVGRGQRGDMSFGQRFGTGIIPECGPSLPACGVQRMPRPSAARGGGLTE